MLRIFRSIAEYRKIKSEYGVTAIEYGLIAALYRDGYHLTVAAPE
jgi:hypothetical protein